jgi:membrane protease YdiL (CAAX protease family)
MPARMYQPGYVAATRHPWSCLLFLLPLLSAYEAGLVWMGGQHPEALRSGADTWLHWGMEAFGIERLYAVPGLVLALLLARSCPEWRNRPIDWLGVCAGMAIESVVFALGLWALGRALTPFLQSLGIQLALAPQTQEAVMQILTFVGAGIYEEVLFRLLIFSGLAWLLRQFTFAPPKAILLAALASALLFSAAHHAGPYGERFEGYAFLFRTMAGLYFTFLYQFRGFGIAVGAHVCYDVLVGIKIV